MQGREEFVIEACWLWCLQLCANVSGHAKVRVLVDSTGNEARNVLVSEEVRETRRKAGCGLNGWIRSLSTAIAELQSENSLQRCQIDMPLEPADVRIEESHVLRIQANEGVFGIEANRKNIFDILISQMRKLLEVSSFLVEVLLVIGDLDDKGHSEGLLHVLAEDERQHVAEMECFRGRSSSRVEVKRRDSWISA